MDVEGGREKCLKPYSLTPKGVYFDRSTLAQSSKFGWTHFEDNAFKNIRFFSYENKLFHTHSVNVDLKIRIFFFPKVLRCYGRETMTTRNQFCHVKLSVYIVG